MRLTTLYLRRMHREKHSSLQGATGWGWGLPLVWQGWLVLAVCLGLIGGIVAAFARRNGAIRFGVLVAFASALLTPRTGTRVPNWRGR